MAVSRINRAQVKDLPAGVAAGYEAIVRLEGADCQAGTVATAVWMGKALVRLACNHCMIDLDEVTQTIQQECNVRKEDRVPPPAPPPKPKPSTKRPREPKDVPNATKLGGPLDKVPKPGDAGEKRSDEEEEEEVQEEEEEDAEAAEEEEDEENDDEGDDDFDPRHKQKKPKAKKTKTAKRGARGVSDLVTPASIGASCHASGVSRSSTNHCTISSTHASCGWPLRMAQCICVSASMCKV